MDPGPTLPLLILANMPLRWPSFQIRPQSMGTGSGPSQAHSPTSSTWQVADVSPHDPYPRPRLQDLRGTSVLIGDNSTGPRAPRVTACEVVGQQSLWPRCLAKHLRQSSAGSAGLAALRFRPFSTRPSTGMPSEATGRWPPVSSSGSSPSLILLSRWPCHCPLG